jgi:hypothetical protein
MNGLFNHVDVSYSPSWLSISPSGIDALFLLPITPSWSYPRQILVLQYPFPMHCVYGESVYIAINIHHENPGSIIQIIYYIVSSTNSPDTKETETESTHPTPYRNPNQSSKARQNQSCPGHKDLKSSRSCATAGLCLAQSSKNRIISSFQRSQPAGSVSRTRGLGEWAMQ